MECFAKTVNGCIQSTTFAKSPILDVWLVSKVVYDYPGDNLIWQVFYLTLASFCLHNLETAKDVTLELTILIINVLSTSLKTALKTLQI